jgi:peptidoglycan/xylan/chitin deacetylase (PgdA/CDA1 family)
MYGLRTLARSARWLRSRFRGQRALILGYHRVNASSWDPYALSVTPQHFSEQLEALRKHANPISLQTLTESLQRGEAPSRSVVITLDDGYADNLHNAKSLLLRHEVPATVFVATGYIGGRFWWDELAEILQPPLPLPETIRLVAEGRTFERNLPRRIDIKVRKGVVLALYNFIRRLPSDARANAIAQLRNASGTKSDEGSPIRALTQDELHELAAGGLVDIGAHTVTHPFLSTLTEISQKGEIAASKADLEKLLERPVTSFSFPNGSASRVTTEAVRDAGFLCACGTYADVVSRGSNLVNLPRLWVPNCDGATFGRWLTHWMGT